MLHLKKPFSEILRVESGIALLFQEHTSKSMYQLEFANDFNGPWSVPLRVWTPEGYTDPNVSRSAFHEIRTQASDALVLFKPSSFRAGTVPLSDTGLFYMKVSKYTPVLWSTGGSGLGPLLWEDLEQNFDGVTGGTLLVENGLNSGSYTIVSGTGHQLTLSIATPLPALSTGSAYSYGDTDLYSVAGGSEQGIFVMPPVGFWRSRNPMLAFEGSAPVAASFTTAVAVWLPRSCKLLKILDYGGGDGLWVALDDEGPEWEIPDTTEFSTTEASAYMLSLRGGVPYGGGPYGTRFRVIAVF